VTRGVAITTIYCSRDTTGGLVNLAHTTWLVSYSSAIVARAEVRCRAGMTGGVGGGAMIIGLADGRCGIPSARHVRVKK
jgi:hypothetical protein